MQRYAVLRDLDTPDLRPIGLAVERADRVNLVLAADCGLRTEFHDAYTVTEPDGGDVVYHPGRPEYFNHVLVTLSRTFLVAEIEEVEDLDSVATIRLFHDKVVSKQPRPAACEYPLQPPLRILPAHRPHQWSATGRAGARHGAGFRIAA